MNDVTRRSLVKGAAATVALVSMPVMVLGGTLRQEIWFNIPWGDGIIFPEEAANDISIEKAFSVYRGEGGIVYYQGNPCGKINALIVTTTGMLANRSYRFSITPTNNVMEKFPQANIVVDVKRYFSIHRLHLAEYPGDFAGLAATDERGAFLVYGEPVT